MSITFEFGFHEFTNNKLNNYDGSITSLEYIGSRDVYCARARVTYACV